MSIGDPVLLITTKMMVGVGILKMVELGRAQFQQLIALASNFSCFKDQKRFRNLMIVIMFDRLQCLTLFI